MPPSTHSSLSEFDSVPFKTIGGHRIDDGYGMPLRIGATRRRHAGGEAAP